MNLFSNGVAYLYYMLAVSLLLHVPSLIEPNQLPINVCSLRESSQSEMKQSFFVEQLTEDPHLLHISEPIRLTFTIDQREEGLNELAGTWITIYMVQDASYCFVPDHNKTKEMEQKSEHLHNKLQRRMGK